MRINARLDDEDAKKLEYLVRRERKSVTEVLRASIDWYYRQVRASPSAALRAMRRADFIGCAEGAADLSKSYKRVLAKTLVAKHGDR